MTLPDATSPDAFIKWAKSLPASNPPTWLGLAPNAEAALLASRGEQLLSTWQVTDQFMSFWVANSSTFSVGYECWCRHGRLGLDVKFGARIALQHVSSRSGFFDDVMSTDLSPNFMRKVLSALIGLLATCDDNS